MEEKRVIQIPENIEINVDVFAILLGVDKTLLDVNIGDGYRIEEVFLDECKFKDKIVMGDKSISDKYFLSQIKDVNEGKEKISFICITKRDKLQYPCPRLDKSFYISDKNPLFDDEMLIYKDNKYRVIFDFISKSMLFKEGDIGIYEVFFNFQYQFLFMNNNFSKTVLISDANIICRNIYTLNKSEQETFIKFLTNHNQAFQLLNKTIDSFTYSYKLLYDAKAFEQITTTLEILFLKKGESMKKENLSKRVAVFLGTDNTEVLKLYKDVKAFYKYRSESTHEGIDVKITKKALLSLKEYTRRSIKRYFDIIEEELLTNPSCDFSSIKIKIILQLQSHVIVKVKEGVLPEVPKRRNK